MKTIPLHQARLVGFALLTGVLGLLLLVHYMAPREKTAGQQVCPYNFINLLSIV